MKQSRKNKLLQIIYEDDYLIAINKPPRMASVPADNYPLHQTALGVLQRQLENTDATPYPLHRLDLDTSGAMLFGKHEKDRRILENIFHHPDTHKKYIALVKGVPHGKTIMKKLPSRTTGEEVYSRTDYKIMRTFRILGGPLLAQVEAEIATGRKHQIRLHFASVGHPIILDSRYGDIDFNRKFRIRYHLSRQALHAASLGIFHPILKKHVVIEAPLAPDLKSIIKKLTY